MAHTIRKVRSVAALTLALALAAGPAFAASTAQPVTRSDPNRSLDTEHVPVVERTDYVFDAMTGPSGLVPGEADRLAGWFDGLDLGYGDTVTLDTSGAWHPAVAADKIASVVADYGMLVSHEALPANVGHPAAGSIRVIVSRATAHVDGCPDWSIGNTPTHNNTTTSDFGCAYVADYAAMIANPQDLVAGVRHGHGSDAMVSVKAIKAYRDATTTGANNALKNESSQSGGSK